MGGLVVSRRAMNKAELIKRVLEFPGPNEVGIEVSNGVVHKTVSNARAAEMIREVTATIPEDQELAAGYVKDGTLRIGPLL